MPQPELSTSMPLFTSPEYVCDLCLNTGLSRNSKAVIHCPVYCSYSDKNSTMVLFNAVTRNGYFETLSDYQSFDIARILTRFSSAKPCPRRQLEELFFELHGKENHGDTERKIKGYIETLRRDWLLPIGSRKAEPAGYWIITELEDFKHWFDVAKSAPITQLSTIHRVAKHNFPVFAEQIELDFWKDMKEAE